jgi:Fe-S cluster assembly protein SufD
MDSARADALSARTASHAGWIPRSADSFRHLPPPGAEVWLGEPAPQPTGTCDASPLAGAGWTCTRWARPAGRVDARWLDAADPAQRAELFAGLPAPGDDDAAPFAWAHRALVPARPAPAHRRGPDGEAPAATRQSGCTCATSRVPRSRRRCW